MSDNRIILWFGAGVSGDSGMPLGLGLTRKWLEHHLPDGEAERILGLFAGRRQALGKDAPRLEKVIEDAVWTFGHECLANLDIFGTCPPNHVHRAIADHVRRHRIFAVTTNFDSAVEVSPGDLPIPVLTPAGGNGDWGLIKLHGSIGEDLPTLGHSIVNLQNGLAPHLASLIDTLLDDPAATFVFAGYSGVDVFDVVPFFEQRERLGRPVAARAVWLHHTPEPHPEWADDDFERALSDGAKRMLAAFSDGKRAAHAGRTADLLRSVAGLEVDEPHGPAVDRDAWKTGWSRRFAPAARQRRLYAAKLYASFGLGRDSARFVEPNRLAHDRVTEEHQLLANALRNMGCIEAEWRLRRWMAAKPSDTYPPVFNQRHLAASARLSGRHIRALRLYARLLGGGESPGTARERLHQAWAIGEAAGAAAAVLDRIRGSRLPEPVRGAAILVVRQVLATALRRFGQVMDWPESTDPQLLATVQRASDRMGDSAGWLIDTIELRILHRRGLPVLNLHGRIEENQLETDSLLGSVNALRWRAQEWLGWTADATDAEDRRALLRGSTRHALDSYVVAEAIEDLPGQIKAMALLERCYGQLGRYATVRLCRQARKRFEHHRRALDRTMSWMVNCWVDGRW